jgi:mercuric ion binding protein
LPHYSIHYEIAYKPFCVAECSRRTPVQLICGNVTNRHARCEEYDLRGLSNHGEEALEKVAGVTSATVNFDKKQAQVTFDDGVATVDKLREATANAGYPATLMETN